MRPLAGSIAACCAAVTFLALPAFAETRIVRLDVQGMTCDLCSIAVRKSLQKLPGVQKVEVSYERREAVVTFDDSKVSADALTKATGNAGFPSTLKEEHAK